MSGLKVNETSINLDTLYEVVGRVNTYNDTLYQKTHGLWINIGSVDMWASSSATEPTAMSNVGGMTLSSDDTELEADVIIEKIPRYFALKQNTGVTTEIILAGIIVEEVKAVS